MRKRTWLACVCAMAAVLFIAGPALSGTTLTDTITMPAPQTPALIQLVGSGAIELGPSRYPEFYDFSSDNPTCGENLKKSHKDGGMSLAPLGPDAGQFVEVGGLTVLGFKVGEEYRNTAKLLFTWSIRVEGYKPDIGAYAIWPGLCSPWHGTSYQRFPGGEVKSMLYINGQPVTQCPAAALTIPDAGSASITQPRDPTLTGSCLITKEFFGGSFPATIDIMIKWQNDTCLKIVSPTEMRSLVVTSIPVTSMQQER